MHFTGFAIVNTGALADVNAHRDHRAFFHDHAFNHFGACADEAVVFDDGRVRLQWLQNTTDTHAARKVNVFTDLRTGANGGPGINHGAFINVCANVHIGWHQHGVTRDKCTLANRRRWHHTETFFLETRFVVISEFHWHFIEVAAFRTVDNLVIVNTEREQYRFLQPLMSDPLTVDFFGYTQRAGIKQRNNLINRLAGHGIHICRSNFGATLKSGLNNVL